jgi:uncharacterized membrane protein HdeD (DUF308 family)
VGAGDGRVERGVVSDIVTVLIGMMLGLEWPVSGAWTVGTFVAST